MKKIMMIIVVVLGFLLINTFMVSSIVIPEDAIRFRVIANSNTKEDQEVKQEVSKVL